MSRLDAYILRYGDFCANDDDMTDYFTPCACVRGKYLAINNTYIPCPVTLSTGVGRLLEVGLWPDSGHLQLEGVVAAGYLWQPEMVYMTYAFYIGFSKAMVSLKQPMSVKESAHHKMFTKL